MKSLTLSLLLLSSVSAFSATVAVTRGGLGVTPVTTTGTVLSTGGFYIAAGAYAIVPTITAGDFASVAAAAASFIEFAAATSPTAVGATQGTITGSFTGGLSNAAAFNGREIFLLVGNAATRAASTEFAFLRALAPNTWTYTADVSAADSISVVMRDVTSFTTIANGGTPIDIADTLAKDQVRLVSAVPEVSSSLLMGLAGLLLSVRRRK